MKTVKMSYYVIKRKDKYARGFKDTPHLENATRFYTPLDARVSPINNTDNIKRIQVIEEDV